MKKLLALMLSLALSASLLTPALAAEAWQDLAPPLWQALQFSSLEEYMSGTGLTAEAYVEKVDWMKDYLSAHPEEASAFDADAYYNDGFWSSPMPGFSKETWVGRQAADLPGGYTERDFYNEMKANWLEGRWQDHINRLHWTALTALYPDDFAAFDADAWFAGYSNTIIPDWIAPGEYQPWTKAAYLKKRGPLTEEEFRQAMFSDCVGQPAALPRHVAVDGVPLQFPPDAQPILWPGDVRAGTADVLWVPARAVGEALGYAVTYDAAAGQAAFTRPGQTAVFTVGSPDYTVNGAVHSLPNPDAPAYAENGRLYLPIPQLADALGCAWSWNTPHSAVFLQTTDKD